MSRCHFISFYYDLTLIWNQNYCKTLFKKKLKNNCCLTPICLFLQHWQQHISKLQGLFIPHICWRWFPNGGFVWGVKLGGFRVLIPLLNLCPRRLSDTGPGSCRKAGWVRNKLLCLLQRNEDIQINTIRDRFLPHQKSHQVLTGMDGQTCFGAMESDDPDLARMDGWLNLINEKMFSYEK